MNTEVGNEDMREPEEVIPEKTGKPLFPLPIVFGVGIATLFISLAVFAGQAGLERRLKTMVAPGGQAEVWMDKDAVTVDEGDGVLRVAFVAINPTDQNIKFKVRTLAGGSATGGNGQGGEADYEISERIIVVEPIELVGDIFMEALAVPIYPDTRVEGDEKFRVAIEKVEGNFRIPAGKKETVVTITEGCNEANPSAPPMRQIECKAFVKGKVKTDTRTGWGVARTDTQAKRIAYRNVQLQFDKNRSCSKWEPYASGSPAPGTPPEDIVEENLCCDKPPDGVDGCEPKVDTEKCESPGKITGCEYSPCRATNPGEGPGKYCEVTCYFECDCELSCQPINLITSPTPTKTPEPSPT